MDDFTGNYKQPSGFERGQAEEILLLKNLSRESPDYFLWARKHIFIVAQRFHPDRSNKSYKEVCNKTMSCLNQAICENEASVLGCDSEIDKHRIMSEGKLYVYATHEIITCSNPLALQLTVISITLDSGTL